MTDIIVYAAFIASFLFVVLAEMGDKTQLLAMAFATKYVWYKVLFAVFLATIFNHSLAAILGQFLTTVVPLDLISLAAAFSFIGFGLWTIRGDKLGGEADKVSKFGPVATVGIAFFFAEMGDKTQLATISLAVQYNDLLSVVMGTTLGMLVSNAIGIIIGIVLQKKIPERMVKWFSASIFILFGEIGVFQGLEPKIGLIYTLAFIVLLTITSLYVAYLISKKQDKTNNN